jgi:hypothetical protein
MIAEGDVSTQIQEDEGTKTHKDTDNLSCHGSMN